MSSKYVDQMSNIMVLGGLLREPSILDRPEKYAISDEDFVGKTQQMCFLAINNLFVSGLKRIEIVDIVNYLQKNYPAEYIKFEKDDGVELLKKAITVSTQDKFDYYYNRMKKFSLLRAYDRFGIDVNDIYNINALDLNLKEKQERWLEECELQDIVDIVDRKIEKVKKAALLSGIETGVQASEGIFDLLDRLDKFPEVGVPLPFGIYNTITAGARLGKVYLSSAASGKGKALPNSVKIPLANGEWKTVGEVVRGDKLIDRKGNPTTVLETYPQGELEVYEITFKDGRTARCSGDHLWTYYYSSHRNDRAIRTETLEEIIKRQEKNKYLIKIPINEPVRYEKKEYSIDPYVLGLALGDGSFRYDKSNKAFTYSSKDIELVEYICEIMGWKYKKNSDFNYSYSFEPINTYIGHKNIWVEDFLRDYPELWNIKSEDKFIPKEFLFGSIEQRLSLLQGLLDTDGNIDGEKGRVSFSTISEKLKDNIVQLCRSLGFITTVTEDRRENKYPSTGVCYTIHIQTKKEFKSNLFRLKRKKKIAIDYTNNKKRYERKDYNSIVKIEKLNEKEEMTCFYVDNEEHLFLMNDYIVTHNTRNMVADACYFACSEIWNSAENSWNFLATQEPTLFISTELQLEEVQTMMLAFISGVNESKILNKESKTSEERERIYKAAKILQEAPIYVSEMPDFSLSDIENTIKANIEDYDVKYICLDYIHTSLKILSEVGRATNGIKIREDQVLFMLSIRLKDLANQYGVFIQTATQTNALGESGEDANASMLRGARAIADKVDFAEILTGLSQKDKDAFGKINQTLGLTESPNLIRNVFKNRRGEFTNGKLWCKVDLGTCRFTPLFWTDNDYNVIPVPELNIQVRK